MKQLLTYLFTCLTVFAQSQWEIISPPVDNLTHSYKNLHFINRDTGFVVGAFEGTPSILRTVDGGVTWDTTDTGDIGQDPDGSPYAIHFPTDSVGYVACTWQLFKTSDYGESWFEIDTTNTYENTGAAPDIYFLNNDTGYVGWADGGADFLYTYDGGLSWDTVAVALGVRHFNHYNGKVTAAEGAVGILDTQNLQWDVYQGFNEGYYHYRNSIYLNTRLFYIGSVMGSSSSGVYAYSDDLGQNWEVYELGASLEDIVFVNDTTGFMVGGFWGTLRTTDGGETWYKTEIDDLGTGMSKAFEEVCFVNDTVGYAVSLTGIYKTTNAGGANQQEVYFWPYDLSVEQENVINVGVYPNPANNIVQLDAGEHLLKSAEIFSLDGRIVISNELSGNTAKIDVSELRAGAYLVIIETDKGRIRAQIVKN